MADFLATLLTIFLVVWWFVITFGERPRCPELSPTKPVEIWFDKDTKVVLPFQTRSCISK